MEQSSFFNSVAGDRLYDAEQFATYFKQFLSTGLYHTNNVPALYVSFVSGLQCSLSAGSAFIEGYMYNNTIPITFTHSAADPTNPRIDRIVLRLDRSTNARNIKAFIKQGTAATTPAPPALQRDAVIYELSLAQIRINAGSTVLNTIQDESLDPEFAGIVHSLITVPTEQFQAQWDAWFTSRQNEIGLKVVMGAADPAGPNIASGDIWFKVQ